VRYGESKVIKILEAGAGNMPLTLKFRPHDSETHARTAATGELISALPSMTGTTF